MRTDVHTGNFCVRATHLVFNILAIEIKSLAVMDDVYDDKEGGHTYGML